MVQLHHSLLNQWVKLAILVLVLVAEDDLDLVARDGTTGSRSQAGLVTTPPRGKLTSPG